MAGTRRRGGARSPAKSPGAKSTQTQSAAASSDLEVDASPSWLAYVAVTCAVLVAAYFQKLSADGHSKVSSPAGGSRRSSADDVAPPRRTEDESQKIPRNVDANLAESRGAKEEESTGSSSWTFSDLDDVLGPVDGPEAPFDGLKVFVHRNGDPTPCGGGGRENADFGRALRRHAEATGLDPIFLTMWQSDAIVSQALVDSVLGEGECLPAGSEAGEISFWDFCDMGPDRTPILYDHEKLIPVRPEGKDAKAFLPCHFHTREGMRIRSLDKLTEIAREAKGRGDATLAIHLWAVPAGRVFMFAPSAVGETFSLDHVPSPQPNKPIQLEVLSVSPRVFDIKNFFTHTEAATIVGEALVEADESMQRSTTVGRRISVKRTSSNAFVTKTRTARALKMRASDVLGHAAYANKMADGLQVLRYNVSQSYVSHYDFFDDKDAAYEGNDHNYNSSGVGTNRYATILLYLTEPEEGGATVFSKAEETMPLKEAIENLRQSETSILFEQGSWEEKLAAQCQSHLAIQPRAARAVLFYSMLPNGKLDEASYHGGCPVIKGEKWAANVWFFNGVRSGYSDAPKRRKAQG